MRAVSIFFVLIAHLTGTRNFPGGLHSLAALGLFGVGVFFVISGFLITTLLLKEMAAAGTVSLVQFYKRRILRLIPAFVVFVGVVAFLAARGSIVLLPNDLLHALTYTINYHHPHSWYLGHIWSLSVEEQFYLLWPSALVLLGIRRGLIACAAVIALAPFIRSAMHLAWPENYWMGQHFQAVADSLAIGCLLAGAWNWLHAQTRFVAFMRSAWFWAIPAVCAVAVALQDRPKIDALIGRSVINTAIALCIFRWVSFPDTAAGRFLNLAFLRWVGALSYSLYLWQQLFLNRHSEHWANAFPANLLLTFGAAVVSYYAIETPFLKLKNKKKTARPGEPSGKPARTDPGPSGPGQASGREALT